MTIVKPQIQAISDQRCIEPSRKPIRTITGMGSGCLVTAKCLNLPRKCDSAVAECRFVSLKPQQEPLLRHVPLCHGADWMVVKLELAMNTGKSSFQMDYRAPLSFPVAFCLFIYMRVYRVFSG